MAKNPFMPIGSKGGGGGPSFGKMPGGDLTPDGGSSGRPGAKKGMPNFKSRITKPGGMAKGGMVKGCAEGGAVKPEKYRSGGAVKAGQGSGIGRLQRSK